MTTYYADPDRYSFVRGDNVTINFIVYSDSAKSVRKNITGATFLFTIRKRWDDTLYIIQKAGVITDAVNGELSVTLTPTETTQNPVAAVADLEMILGGLKDTPWVSGFQITEDVT